MLLSAELESVKKHVPFPVIPDYIADNLAYELRDYQKEAVSRFLFYDSQDSSEKSPHLLWQMATGSGKTLIMAALILEMYQKGYRNFWFFVNSTDIITKTIDNFTRSSAKKYQFAPKIEWNGRCVDIRRVENFAVANSDTLNIKFSTINILHQISQPDFTSEDSVTLEDFSNTPLILIGDEAHHLNAATKKEQADENSWERSVQRILQAHPKNRLFEFTATANLSDKNIAEKYDNKLIYNYDLRHFRNDKFSKDVFTFSTDGENEEIMLRAVLVSQYRKHIAADYGIDVKPVILFKSKMVAESKANFEHFNQFITDLTAARIKNTWKKNTQNDIWNKTVDYFIGKEKELCAELKLDFAFNTKKVLLHDGTNKRMVDQPKLLATLENEDNPVRAIFAVNMLQEGWDVLNLFDIVRLYDTRDGSTDKKGHYSAGKGTVSEAQLIGRGARYYPFPYMNNDKYRRKFDDNESEVLRVIEQMHYHCKHNPKYISELRQTLMESGILPGDDLIEITLKMKQDYIDGKYKKFQDKNVYVNQIFKKNEMDFNQIDVVKKEIAEQNIVLFPDFSSDEMGEIHMSSRISQSQSLLESESRTGTLYTGINRMGMLSEWVPANVIRYVLNGNKNFTFDKLKKTYPELKSMSQFAEILGKKKIITTESNVLSSEERTALCQEVLNRLDAKIKEERKQVMVSKHFYPQSAGKNFEQTITRKYRRNEQSESFAYDWYVYENSVLTSEEKSFLTWFADTMMTQKASGKTELEESGWTDIFLARNEKAVKLFSWFLENLGEGFEPDFVLFMQKDAKEYVFYIEPKGDWTYDSANKKFGKEQWKENLLQELEGIVTAQHAELKETENWRLIGLPFYNDRFTKQHFADAFREKTHG